MRKKNQKKINIIFQAAVRIFSVHGFHEAKMDEIARLAGIAKGTIYYHFKSKEDLFIGLVDGGIDKLLSSVLRNIRKQKTPKQQLEKLLAVQLQFCIENHELSKLLLAESFGSEKRQLYLRKKIRSYLDLIDGVLREGSRQGDLSVAYPRETATAIFGALSILSLDRFYNQENAHNDYFKKNSDILQETASNLLLPAFSS